MNLATFERAMLVDFAYSEARYTGSLGCMKAVCYVVRNRVRAGWGDGSWMQVMLAHTEVEGNLAAAIPSHFRNGRLDNDRLLQLLLRDIDDIYLGTAADLTADVVDKALYYQAIDLSPRAWFVEHIVGDPANHPRVAQVGPLAFFN